MIPAASQVLRSRRLVATAILALPLAYLLALSGGVSFPLALTAMAVVCYVVMSAGFLLLRAAHATDLPSAAAWVMGVFASSIAVYALVELLRIPAFESFALWAVLILTLATVAALRGPPGPRLDRRDLLGLLLCAGATLMWCRGIAAAPEVFARERLFPAWIDYFIHGGVIAQFGDRRSLAHLSYDLADFPLRLYHYASYQLAAAFAEPLDLPGLPLATSVWLPLGFLTMCAGAYALGVALAGHAGGVIALASVTLIPDAGSYALRNGFFSYYWNMLASPGSTYAVGIALLAVAFLTRGATPRALLSGFVLAAGTLLFRVHVFVLALPAWLTGAGMSLPVFRRRRILFATLVAAGSALAVLALYAFLVDHATGWSIAGGLEMFLDEVHLNQEPTAYTGWYEHLKTYGDAVAFPAGILLVLAACLGVFVVLYPAALLLARRRLSAIDCFPAIVIAFYVLLMVFAPVPPHEDATELTQRPFVFLYALVAIGTSTMLTRELILRVGGAPERIWAPFFAAAMAGILIVWSQVPAMSHLRVKWAGGLDSYVAEEGLPEAAAFLRRNAKPGDILAASPTKLGFVSTDVATQLSSLSGLPAYLTRPFIQIVPPGPRADLAKRRHADLERIEQETSADSALALLDELGIRWYVFVGPEGPAWDRSRSRAAFTAGKVAVYASAAR